MVSWLSLDPARRSVSTAARDSAVGGSSEPDHHAPSTYPDVDFMGLSDSRGAGDVATTVSMGCPDDPVIVGVPVP